MAAGVYEASHRRGVIPACAGSTVRRALRPPLSAGSSPHARGAQRRLVDGRCQGGIIPARAGSTRGLRAAHPRRGDHPRMRGEHSARWYAASVAPGSSPHARGARQDAPVPRVAPGIIPACAGSTPAGRWSNGCARDHPRMRGEHSCLSGLLAWQGGSSPHARGARLVPERNTLVPGIIPACAGSTLRAPWP